MHLITRLMVVGFIVVMLVLTGVSLFLTDIIRINSVANNPGAIVYFNCNQKAVALTIDDGPDVTSTSDILDLLEKHNASATFFIVGERMNDSELLKRIVQSNSELGNHGFTEQPLIYIPEDSARESIALTHRLISKYQEVTWFRPPSGMYDANVLNEMERYDYRLVLGDVYPYDHMHESVWFSRWYIQTYVKSGSIIILHESNGRGATTLAVLEKLLRDLKTAGYQVMSLSGLYSLKNCRIP